MLGSPHRRPTNVYPMRGGWRGFHGASFLLSYHTWPHKPGPLEGRLQDSKHPISNFPSLPQIMISCSDKEVRKAPLMAHGDSLNHVTTQGCRGLASASHGRQESWHKESRRDGTGKAGVHLLWKGTWICCLEASPILEVQAGEGTLLFSGQCELERRSLVRDRTHGSIQSLLSALLVSVQTGRGWRGRGRLSGAGGGRGPTCVLGPSPPQLKRTAIH